MNEPKDYEEQDDNSNDGVLLVVMLIGGLSFAFGLLIGMWVG